jgi:hypothetical protein
MVGAGLRVLSHNWDDGHHFYPDEALVTESAMSYANLPPGTGIGELLDPQRSPINSRAEGRVYPYGTLPVYLTKVASGLAYAVSGNPTLTSFDGIQQTGRVMSGLADTLTALLLFILGARLWGRWWGLLSAALYAFALLPVQVSHYYISETFMGLFMTGCLLFSVLYYLDRRRQTTDDRRRTTSPELEKDERLTGGINGGDIRAEKESSVVRRPSSVVGPRLWPLALAGLCAGLAMACKVSAAPVLLLPVAAAVLREARTRQWVRMGGLLGLAGATALLGLFIGDPFAILDAPTYLAQVREQAGVQSGNIDLWFTRRYIGTWPVLYPGAQLLLIGVGPIVGLAGLAGVATVAARMRRSARNTGWLLLLGAGIYFASIAFLETKWVRYLVPLVPYLCLFATAFAYTLWQMAPQKQLWLSIKRGVPAVLVGSTLLGAIAYASIYGTEHTMVRASRWIYEHIPPGSKIAIELNNTALPVPMPGHDAPDKEYTLVPLGLLGDHPGEEMFAILHDGLSEADYIVTGSTRAAGTVPRLPWRYPVQGRYFELLKNGTLGFDLAYTAASYPSIFGLQIPDHGDLIDDSFTEYDHPTVQIYRKARTLTDAEWSSLFAEAVRQPSVPSRYPPGR